jgi:hypothetical protein
MRKMKWQLMFVALVMMAGIAFAGCSKKAEKAAAPAAPPVAAEKAAAPAAAENAAPAKTDEYSVESLCNKLVAETKAISGVAFSAAVAARANEGCLKAAKTDDKNPNEKAVRTAYVKTIMDACKGKSGQEWLGCYAQQGPSAAKAAMDAAVAK